MAETKSYTFTIIIEKEPEDPGYFAHVVELPGCFGAGLTVDETKQDIHRAIELHLESLTAHGVAIPDPLPRPTIAEVTFEVPA